MAMTEAELIAKIAKYETAEEAILLGQSYTLDGRTWTYADLDKIRSGLEYYQKKLDQIDGTRPRVSGGRFSGAASQ